MSKGGFFFSAAKFLPGSMKSLEDEILLKLPSIYRDRESLIRDVATVHGELLFIHPFREGMAEQRVYLPILWLEKQVLILWNLKK